MESLTSANPQSLVGAVSLSDESIENTVHFAEDAKEGIDHPTYDDKRRMMERLRIVATVKNGAIVSVNGLIEFYTPKSVTAVVVAFRSRRPAVSRSTL